MSELSKYELEIIKWQQEFYLSDEFVNDIETKEFLDEYTGMKRFVMLKKIACDERRTEYYITIDFPSNWFQHLRKRLGLKYKTEPSGKYVTFTERLFFPNLPIKDVEQCKPYFKKNSI